MHDTRPKHDANAKRSRNICAPGALPCWLSVQGLVAVRARCRLTPKPFIGARLVACQDYERQTPISTAGHGEPGRIHDGPRRHPSLRHPNRDHLVAVPPINSEVSIQREHLSRAVDFRESNQTGVG